MGFLLGIWNGLKDGLEWVLRLYEGLMEPFLGAAAWGVAIILLTATVRLFMIPLMVRQVRSMRAMQELQPQLKKIQEKYKVDRSMMKTDPDRYRKIKEKQREAQMALYQEHQVNPVGGCLPLLLQMPIFLALFQVLQEPDRLSELANAPFLGITSLTDTAQGIVTGGSTGTIAVGAAVSALGLVILQVVTTYFSTKQMMARNTQAAAEQQQAQKIMLYLMPPFLGFLSFTFPLGVVLYWATTNVWTIGQQAFIFRQVEAEEARKAAERDAEKTKGAKRKQVDDVAGEDDSEAITDKGPKPSANGHKGKSPQGKSPQGRGPQGRGPQGKGKGPQGRGPQGEGQAGSRSKRDPSPGRASGQPRDRGKQGDGAAGPNGQDGGRPAPRRGQKRQPGSRSGPQR